VEGTHRLAQQRPGPHYALVRVTIEPRTQRTVYISPNAFSWLHATYGYKAKEGPALEDYKSEALSGAMFALEDAEVGGEVTVTEIGYAPADTGAGDVRYAAAFAVWEALDHAPVRSPWIDEAGIHFPDT
jgi:uncharacterized protein (AIM24 family)